MAKVDRGETVWKIAEGFSTVRFWRQEAAGRGFFTPSWRSSEPRFGTHSDFPNSFGRGILRSSSQQATPKQQQRSLIQGMLLACVLTPLAAKDAEDSRW